MPTITLNIKDENATGKILNEVKVSFANNLATVKDIIKARVFAEVDAYNNRMPEYYKGLVQPGDAETTLNGYKMKARKKVDAEAQITTALDAFYRNGYFVLIDNIQAEELDQMIVVNEQTQISFVKLTPLVGG